MVNFQSGVDYQSLSPAFSPAIVSAPVPVQINWKWENDNGDNYNDFDVTISNMLETAYRTNPNNTSYVITLHDGTEWRFDFKTMTQKNTKTGSARRIWRPN
jgi:hypothetical protein